MPDSIKVGISGPPGAGKSSLAERLTARTEEPTYAVIDDYVPDLIEQTGLAFAEWANYTQNLQVAFERYTAEKTWWKGNVSTITVGTILDTIMYAAMYADVTMSRNVAERQALMARAETAMRTFGMLVSDTWAYDYCFWLPYTDETRPETGYDTLWDQQFFSVVESFGQGRVVKLSFDNEDDNLELAYKVIETIEKEKRESEEKAPTSTETDEQSIRASGNLGEEVGDTVGPMPDVSGS